MLKVTLTANDASGKEVGEPAARENDAEEFCTRLRVDESMTRRFAALGCVLLLVTAGCAGIGGQTTTAPPQTTADTTESTTTKATPKTESAEQLAPGVTAGDVEDPEALADAHRDALDSGFVKQTTAGWTNESTTRTWNQTFAVENESVWQLTTTGENEPIAFDVTNGTLDSYAGGEYALWQLRNDTAGNTTYGVRSITVDGARLPIPPDQFFENNNYQILYERGLVYSLASNVDSVDALDGSEGAIELSGTAADPPTAFTQSSEVEFTMTVTEDGLATVIDLTHESGDGTVESTITFDTDVTDPVEQPDWYETALNETGLNGATTGDTDAQGSRPSRPV
jgi:hypothetical protein